jgi:curli biogenesis system outer membrane secretion channel CsgG
MPITHRSSPRLAAVGLALPVVLTVFPAVLSAQDKDKLEHCDQPYGALAVVEPQSEMIAALTRYKLSSPTALIRMLVQQSNCFVVVERGAAMRNLMQERELANSGTLQQGSNVGGGQLKAADFVLTPSVLFSEGNAGGMGAAVGGLTRGLGVGALGGGLKFKEAQTSMLISDTRSGVQVASAEGKAKKRDFSLGALGFGGGVFGAVGGYTNTNEGKVVAASFLDNYNNVIASLRNSGLKPAAPGAGGGSGDNVKAGASFNEGDVLKPKINNVKLLAEPNDAAKAVGTVSTSDGLVFLGDEKDGYVHVQGSNGEGWVKKSLVAKGSP